MASQLYPKGAGHILKGDIAFLTATLKLLFYSAAIVTTNEFVSDLTAGSIVARSGALTGVTATNGVVDANDITVLAVSGSAFTHVEGYKDTGADATSLLFANWDIATFTPTGGDVSVIFNASGLFSIA